MHPSMQMQMPQGSRKGALGPRPMHPMPFTPQQQYAPMQYQVPRYQSVQQQHPSPFMQQAQAHGPLSGPQPPLAAPFDARHRPFVGSRSHSMPHAHHHHHHHHQQQMPQQQQLMPFAQGMPPPRPTLPTLGTPTQRFPAVPPMVPQVVPQMVPPTGSQTTTPRSQPIGVPHPLSGFAMVGQQEGSSLPPVGDEGVGELNSIHLSPDEFDAGECRGGGLDEREMRFVLALIC